MLGFKLKWGIIYDLMMFFGLVDESGYCTMMVLSVTDWYVRDTFEGD